MEYKKMENKITFNNLKPQNKGECLICGNKTQNRYYKDSFFDLCEDCKKIKNCFTCRYSKCWYLRNKGKCDRNFEVSIPLLVLLEDDNEDIDKKKKELIKFLKENEIDYENVKEKPLEFTINILEKRFNDKLENKLPDCRLYPKKRIGERIKDFWNAKVCKRFGGGEISSKEFNEFHSDMAYDRWNEEREENWNYEIYFG